MATRTDPATGRGRPGPAPWKELSQGVEAPVLGLGTWQLRGADCERAVAAALEMGYRHVDTAEAYRNEAEVGRALASSGVDRGDVFLASKVSPDHLAPDEVQRACRDSLDRLGTDYLDLYLIHWPNSRIPVAETAGALDELRDEGRIRAWGVSNFTRTHLEEVLEHGRPAVNQVEIHPFLVQDALFEACREWRVPLVAYSPLARGAVPGDPVLVDIGERHGKTAAQVALRWSLDRDRLVIPKASGEEHLRENLDVFDFSLDAEELERIEGLDEQRRLLDPEWGEFDR